jgi:hypothetical protein
MAHPSLTVRSMRRARRCSYLIVLDGGEGDLRGLAAYLSTLGVAGCEVVVADPSPLPRFGENRSVLRWVSRHVAPRPRHCSFSGIVDPIRVAFDIAACEKVIVAGPDVRYAPGELDEVCALLDAHEVVEPQDYLDPLPWWGGIDAGRMLLHRGIEPLPDHGATFAFRKSAIRGLRAIDGVVTDDPVRRLAAQGAEVHSAFELFVRRLPPMLAEWIRQRPRQADDDFTLSLKTAFFFALLPMLLVLALLGGPRLAGGYAGAVAFASVALALRGRAGAARFFPLRACFYAPLWMLERGVSVYWALLRKLRGERAPSAGAVKPAAPSERKAFAERQSVARPAPTSPGHTR